MPKQSTDENEDHPGMSFILTIIIPLSLVMGMMVWLVVAVSHTVDLPEEVKAAPPSYVATCYSNDKIIFERDGVLSDYSEELVRFDCGDREYLLPVSRCVFEMQRKP